MKVEYLFLNKLDEFRLIVIDYGLIPVLNEEKSGIKKNNLFNSLQPDFFESNNEILVKLESCR